MPHKEIRIFDNSNNPLRQSGIRFELFDTITHALVDVGDSHNLNPGVPKVSSNDWGVRLNFTSGTHPLTVYTADPNYRYPGYTIRSLEGSLDDRIDICLVPVPVSPGGQSKTLQSATPTSVLGWVQEAPLWTDDDKGAVTTLVFNYISVVVPNLDDLGKLDDLRKVVENWEAVMKKLEIPVDLLKK